VDHDDQRPRRRSCLLLARCCCTGARAPGDPERRGPAQAGRPACRAGRSSIVTQRCATSHSGHLPLPLRSGRGGGGDSTNFHLRLSRFTAPSTLPPPRKAEVRREGDPASGGTRIRLFGGRLFSLPLPRFGLLLQLCFSDVTLSFIQMLGLIDARDRPFGADIQAAK
jgi:hypothetical protein